jgi:hypothetical protein
MFKRAISQGFAVYYVLIDSWFTCEALADATITMLQHILSTMRYRIENYESLNGLFPEITQATFIQRLDRRIRGLFIEILNIIETLFEGMDEDELI